MRNAFARYSIPSLLFTLITVSIAPAAERVVDLTAKDGAKLKTTYFAAGKPGPGVLLLHQCNRDRKVWNGLAQQLNAAGINVLTLDYRAFGESAGVPHEKATPQELNDEVAKWPGDIDVAYEYLVSQPGVERDAIGVGAPVAESIIRFRPQFGIRRCAPWCCCRVIRITTDVST